MLLPGLTTPAERRTALGEARSEPWVEQAYLNLPRLRFPTTAAPAAEKFYNWNPFLFGGRYAGAIARASDTELINITLGGGLLPTLHVL